MADGPKGDGRARRFDRVARARAALSNRAAADLAEERRREARGRDVADRLSVLATGYRPTPGPLSAAALARLSGFGAVVASAVEATRRDDRDASARCDAAQAALTAAEADRRVAERLRDTARDQARARERAVSLRASSAPRAPLPQSET